MTQPDPSPSGPAGGSVGEVAMLRAALAVSLIALGVAIGALCHVFRVLGC